MSDEQVGCAICVASSIFVLAVIVIVGWWLT